jgi:hypothetical protein
MAQASKPSGFVTSAPAPAKRLVVSPLVSAEIKAGRIHNAIGAPRRSNVTPKK